MLFTFFLKAAFAYFESNTGMEKTEINLIFSFVYEQW